MRNLVLGFSCSLCLVLAWLLLNADRPAKAQAQTSSKEHKVVFVPPIKEQEGSYIKDKQGTPHFVGSDIEISSLDILTMQGWRVVSVHSSAGGICVVLEK